MNWHSDHLAAFRRSLPKGESTDEPGGKPPRKWAECTSLGEALPDAKLNRAALLGMAADHAALETKAVCWSIFAWGAMHGRHRSNLYESGHGDWIEVANRVRMGAHDRKEAYEALRELKIGKVDRLPGVGPAYFTKLIFFLMPRRAGARPVGYIMDQWAGCSINLLADKPVVRMDCTLSWQRKNEKIGLASNFIVSSCNTAQDYENYCRAIEELAAEVGLEPSQTELALMSGGGASKKAWRKYVIKYRQPPHE